MKIKDVITDDYVSEQAVAFARTAKDGTCDWRSLKIALIDAARRTAIELGSPLEICDMNVDGTWVDG